MKKILLATSILAATTGYAAAEVAVSGNGRMGIVYDGNDVQLSSRARVQFNLSGDWSDQQALDFQAAAKARGVLVQVFGLSEGNARAFWNWQFLGDVPDLPRTRAMLMRACDVRLPARLTEAELDYIASALTEAAREVKAS